MSSGQTLKIIGLKAEVTEIKSMVTDLFDIPVIPEAEITTIALDIHVDNI